MSGSASSASLHSPAHIHRLRKMKVDSLFKFRTVACSVSLCKRQLKPAEFLYRCGSCDFTCCEDCFVGDYRSDYHHHRLKPANTAVVYPQTNGDWRCDGCLNAFYYAKCNWSRNCLECGIDLCETCYRDGCVHGLHPNHLIFPVDARLVYRTMEMWFCNNCGEERSTFGKTAVKMFHCDTCEEGIDLCSSCFTGLKYWHHHHNLIQVINLGPKRQYHCSMCSSSVDRSDGVYVCVKGDCDFALCRSCSRLPAPVHPLHIHPLHCCDSSNIYPNTDGLWHCNNCTDSDPLKRMTSRNPNEPMYHCSHCEYDLCTSCYGSYQLSRNSMNSIGYQHRYDERNLAVKPSPSMLKSPLEPYHFVPPPFPLTKDANFDSGDQISLVGGRFSEPVPWRNVQPEAYSPQNGHRMLNHQPSFTVGFQSDTESGSGPNISHISLQDGRRIVNREPNFNADYQSWAHNSPT